MKTMKIQSKILIMSLSVIMILFTSCDKDDDNVAETDEQTITEEEAAEAILMAISPKTGGLVTLTNEAIYLAEGDETAGRSTTGTYSYIYNCGESYSNSFTRSYDNGVYIYDASYNWGWVLSCTSDDTPLLFEFDLIGANSYTTPRMTSEDSNEVLLSLSGLDEQTSEYVVSQTYNREGSQTSFVRAQNSFTSTINFETTDLKILKANYTITSGTALAQFNGEVSNGNTYNFSGEITFNGNQTATIRMGSGNTYEVAW